MNFAPMGLTLTGIRFSRAFVCLAAVTGFVAPAFASTKAVDVTVGYAKCGVEVTAAAAGTDRSLPLNNLNHANRGTGDENETASGAMVQILQVADSAIAAAGEKGTDCQRAAANIAFQAVFDAYSGGILGGFLKAIKSALTNILNLGENGLEEYLKDKLKEAKEAAKDAFKEWLKEKLKGKPPEVFTQETTKAGCDVKIVSTWDIAGGTYEVVVTGNCHCNPVATGGLRSAQLKTFKVVVSGKVSIDLDYNEKIPILHVDPTPKVTVEADCESCSRRKTTKQPEKPGTTPPSSTPGGGGGTTNQPPAVPELPKECNVKPPCKECMPIYDQIMAACKRAKELIGELRDLAGQWDGLQNRIAYAQQELDQLKAKNAPESEIAAKTAELTQLQQEAKNLVLAGLNDGIEFQKLQATLADLAKQLEECQKPPCGPKKKLEQPPTGTTPPPAPPDKPTKTTTGEPQSPGSGGVTPPQGPPVPPAPPQPPPPPTLPPHESRTLAPRKPLPSCWPQGTDAKTACKGWLDIAEQNQLAEDLAVKALADAQSDLNQADRLDKLAQQWADHADKLDSVSKDYADLSESDAAKVASAPNKESAAQWLQFAQDAKAQSKSLALQATQERAQAATIRAQAKALRDRVANDKADEAAKKAAAEASWADYNSCLKLPACPQPGQAVTIPPRTETTTPTSGTPTTPAVNPTPPSTSIAPGGTKPTAAGASGANDRNDGATLGGPIVKDKLWFWSSYGKDGKRLRNANVINTGSSGAPAQSNIQFEVMSFPAKAKVSVPSQPAPAEPGKKNLSSNRSHAGRLELAAYHARESARDFPPHELLDLPAGEAPQDAAPDEIRYSLVANGNSSGEAFELQVFDPSGSITNVDLPEGLVVEPIKPGSAKPVAETATGGKLLTKTLTAYCANYAKAPPGPGMLYRIAPQSVQDQFAPMRSVLQAGREAEAAGKFHPDSDAAAYNDAIRQYAFWTKLESWDEKKFGEVFLAKTKEIAVTAKVTWTPELEQAVRALVPGRWRDISIVLEDAARLSATSAGADSRPAQTPPQGFWAQQ